MRQTLFRRVVSLASTSSVSEFAARSTTSSAHTTTADASSRQQSNAALAPEARQRLVTSIVRVDHAGELSADRIYAGQLAVLRGNAQLAPIIEKMWAEEREHLDTMERLLAKHDVTPTVFAPLCSLAGFALGAGTAMIGEKGAMACTIAVEELIGNHYNDQLKQLVDDDPAEHTELLETISRLRDEELEHHDTGVAYQGLEAPFYQTMKAVIQTGCRGAIWVTQRI